MKSAKGGRNPPFKSDLAGFATLHTPYQVVPEYETVRHSPSVLPGNMTPVSPVNLLGVIDQPFFLNQLSDLQ